MTDDFQIGNPLWLLDRLLRFFDFLSTLLSYRSSVFRGSLVQITQATLLIPDGSKRRIYPWWNFRCEIIPLFA